MKVSIDFSTGSIYLGTVKVASPGFTILQFKESMADYSAIVLSETIKADTTYFRFEKGLSFEGNKVDAVAIEYFRAQCNSCFIHFSPNNKDNSSILNTAHGNYAPAEVWPQPRYSGKNCAKTARRIGCRAGWLTGMLRFAGGCHTMRPSRNL
jgi:hypothetical protein